MKDIQLDTRLVAATNRRSDDTNTFVTSTMRKIKTMQTTSAQKAGFFAWLAHLHKPALVALAFVALTLLGGVVYAAVQFAPALVQLLGKETNSRGNPEYSVSGLTQCAAKSQGPVAERFEVKTDAPTLSDEEVQKIIQAKCELAWLESFPAKYWPTTGPNGKWKNGDTIYYTRLDMIGTVESASDTQASIVLGDRAVEHTPPKGEKIRAFAGGEEIPVSSIKKGDTVFTISRVSETYYDLSNVPGIKDKDTHTSFMPPSGTPKTVGLVALFRLSLPREYYQKKQGYVTEMPACQGNEQELCPNTASIDVYPRGNGEGSTNSYLKQFDNAVYREISGTVTELGDSTLTLKSHKGNLYIVTVGDAGFAVYNRDYTAAYTDVDARLKVGSTISVRYNQPQNADPKQIAKEHVLMISLLLEGIQPKQSVKPY